MDNKFINSRFISTQNIERRHDVFIRCNSHTPDGAVSASFSWVNKEEADSDVDYSILPYYAVLNRIYRDGRRRLLWRTP